MFLLCLQTSENVILCSLLSNCYQKPYKARFRIYSINKICFLTQLIILQVELVKLITNLRNLCSIHSISKGMKNVVRRATYFCLTTSNSERAVTKTPGQVLRIFFYKHYFAGYRLKCKHVVSDTLQSFLEENFYTNRVLPVIYKELASETL